MYTTIDSECELKYCLQERAWLQYCHDALTNLFTHSQYYLQRVSFIRNGDDHSFYSSYYFFKKCCTVLCRTIRQ